MPEAKIPFGPNQASGLDSLGGASSLALNVIMEPTGAIRRRPGIVASAKYSGTVDEGGIYGITKTLWGDYLLVGGMNQSFSTDIGRHVYSLADGELDTLTSATGQMLEGDGRPTFANSEMISVVTAGSNPLKVDLNDVLALLGGSPPLATFVIGNASRLLLNDVSVDVTKVRFSSPAQGTTTYAGLEDWDAVGTSGFFTGEARPDPVRGLYEVTAALLVIGTETTELYVTDPSSLVYARANALEVGIAAPYSFVKTEELCFWLDHMRRFIASNGRSLEVLSGPIQRDLDEMEDVEDCYGFRPKLGALDGLVQVFPSDGRTYAFQKGAGWGQWSFAGPSILSHFIEPGTGTNLVGLSTGVLGELAFGEDDLGSEIECRVQSGYVSRETDARKQCMGVNLALRRGETAGTAPQGFLLYRDQPGPWTGRLPVDLGASPDSYPVVRFGGLGQYRRREWAFEFSGSEDLVLLAATENFEVI